MVEAKVVSLENLARFRDYANVDDVTFEGLSLLYGENATGKTTLAALFRSLQSGDEAPLERRETIDEDGPASIHARIAGNGYRYDGGGWDDSYEDILVFDAEFVDRNVYSGLSLGFEHHQSLHEFVIGEGPVDLSREISAIESNLSRLRQKRSDLPSEIRSRLESDFSLTEFLDADEDPDIDDRIQDLEREFEGASRAEEIREAEMPDQLSIPEVDLDQVEELLSQTLEGVQQDAIDTVRDHMREHLGEGDEPWLEKGYELSEDHESCPFCAQSIVGLDLIESYQAYFSDEYEGLKESIRDLKQDVGQDLADAQASQMADTHQSNLEHLDFWSDFADWEGEGEGPDLGFLAEETRDTIATLRHAVSTKLDEKLSSPLEEIDVGPDIEDAYEEFEEVIESLEEYNREVDQVRTELAEIRDAVMDYDSDEIEAELMEARDLQLRFGELESKALWTINLDEAIAEWEEELDGKREEMEQETQEILDEYKDDINQKLSRFNSKFRIVEFDEDHRGTDPALTYRLELFGEPVNPRQEGGAVDSPSFETALSDGDRRALALAFFLTKAERKVDEEMIVVFDDPFSSFDNRRRIETIGVIDSLAAQAGLTLVLSHDRGFLLEFKSLSNHDPDEAQIDRGQDGLEIGPMRIEDEVRNEFHHNHTILTRYEDGESAESRKDLARTIRPFLETTLSFMYPQRLPFSENLDYMIGEIQAADDDEEIADLQDNIGTLQDLNNFSWRYHHAGTPATDPPDSMVLRDQVETALDFHRGLR